MAEVYLARKDGDLVDRDVVVKRMLPHLAEDARFVQLFLREARIAARLAHPNVVHVLDVGQDGEEYFIAMEYLDGLSALQLAKRVWASGRPLPIAVVAQIVCDAALGLHHAHTLLTEDGKPGNLVHRDISPDNILVTRTGTTKVLDFGIAAGAFAGRMTRTGEIRGKIRYMSPEQVSGDDLDARADVFALGVTLYWLLTGRHAFQGKNDLALMRAVTETEPPPPSSVNPYVSRQIDGFVAGMIAKAREQRTPSTEAVYEQLASYAGPAGARRTAELVALAVELPDPPPRADLEPEADTTPVPLAATEGSGPWAAATDDDGALPEAGSASFQLVPPGDGDTRIAPPPDDPDGPPTRSGASMLEATVRDGSRTGLADVTLDGGDDAALVAAPPTVAARWRLAAAAVAALVVVLAVIGVVASGADAPAVVPVATSVAVAEVPADPGDEVAPEQAEPISAVEPGAPSAPRSTRAVSAQAPRHVKWQLKGGAVLGRGSGTLTVPVDSARIVAIDTLLGGRVSVPVADHVDWGRLPKGELSFIVLPWADVTLGSKALGRTPKAGPVTVVAGSYEVVLSYGDKRRTVRADVPPGGTAVVRESFLE